MNDTRLIAFEDVRELFNIPAGNETQWDGDDIWPPYELRTDGIYAKPAFRLDRVQFRRTGSPAAVVSAGE